MNIVRTWSWIVKIKQLQISWQVIILLTVTLTLSPKSFIKFREARTGQPDDVVNRLTSRLSEAKKYIN